jgi:hypothetical protein
VAGEKESGDYGNSSFSEKGKPSEPAPIGRRALLPAACNSTNAASSGVAADVEPATVKDGKGALRESPSGEPGARDPRVARPPGQTRVPEDQARDQQTAGADTDGGLEKPSAKRRKVDSSPVNETPALMNEHCRDQRNSADVPLHIVEEPQQTAACIDLEEKELALSQDMTKAGLSAPSPSSHNGSGRAHAPDTSDDACLQVSGPSLLVLQAGRG